MPKDPNEKLLDSYIKAEQANIKVEPYEEKVVNQAFRYRTYGYWAGTAMGLTWGTVVGVGVTLALAAANIAAPMAAWQIVTMFGAIGLLAGQASGQFIGASGGAAAAAAGERERRDRARELEQEIRKNPPSQSAMKERVDAYAVEQAERDRNGKSHFNTVQDIHKQTGGNWFKTLRRTVNLRMLAIASLLGAVVGTMLALGGQTVVPGLLLGATSKTAMAIAAASPLEVAGMGALFGAVAGPSFGFVFPAFFTSLSHLTRDMYSGKAFEKSKQPEVSPSVQAALDYAANVSVDKKSYAETIKPRGNSFQETVQYNKQEASTKSTTLGA